MAMHFKFVAYGSTRSIVQLVQPGKRATPLFPGRVLGIVANYHEFKVDLNAQAKVGKLVTAAWQGVPRGREQDEVQLALKLVDDELAASGGDKERQEFCTNRQGTASTPGRGAICGVACGLARRVVPRLVCRRPADSN